MATGNARKVGGQWQAIQSDGSIVNFDITQNPGATTITGSASVGDSTGTGKGRVNGDQFIFTVDWNDGVSKGEYSGDFNIEGRIIGVSVDLGHPGVLSSWGSSKLFSAQ